MELHERYEIRRKLGQGGVGAVYEGYDHQLKRRVAVKRLLDSGDPNSQKAVNELLRECHSLSAINSPNIVRLFDFGQDADGPFVVMELLDGKTLDELIQRAPFIETDFIAVAEQSLEGLLAAHDAHLLHRDLKPCNFMVTWLPSGRMQLKVLDFGLAKFSMEPTKQTIAHGNSLFGSIYFMAPEQFEQKPLDHRTDLYSLGTVFYFALAGNYPFNGESVAQVMAAHLMGRYKDLREYRPDLNPEISKWVMNLMSRNPEHRPESCAVALAQFMGIQNGTVQIPEPIRDQGTGDLPAAAAAQGQETPVLSNTAAIRLNLPGANRNTGPVRLNTGRVTVQAPGIAPSGESALIPLSQRPATHTGAVHVHQQIVAQRNTALVQVTPTQEPQAPQPSDPVQPIIQKKAPQPPFTSPPAPQKSKTTLYSALIGITLLVALVVFLIWYKQSKENETHDKTKGILPLPSWTGLISPARNPL